MAFGHEKLVVYQRAKEFARTAHGLLQRKEVPSPIRDQLRRAATSILLNIAEGNAKVTPKERRRYFETARASAAECAAVVDVLDTVGAVSDGEQKELNAELDGIARMLTGLGKRGFS